MGIVVYYNSPLFAFKEVSMQLRIKIDRFSNCKSLVDFYDVIAAELHKSNAVYDCTKISVGKDIGDLIFKVHEEQGYDKQFIAALMLCMGPKVYNDLDNGTVIVEEGGVV